MRFRCRNWCGSEYRGARTIAAPYERRSHCICVAFVNIVAIPISKTHPARAPKRSRFMPLRANSAFRFRSVSIAPPNRRCTSVMCYLNSCGVLAHPFLAHCLPTLRLVVGAHIMCRILHRAYRNSPRRACAPTSHVSPASFRCCPPFPQRHFLVHANLARCNAKSLCHPRYCPLHRREPRPSRCHFTHYTH